MQKMDVYRTVLRDLVPVTGQLEDVLWLALVLHVYSIVVNPEADVRDVQPDEYGQIVLAPLTRVHIAELLAELWPEDTESGRTDYWSSRYGQHIPFEVLEDIPPAHQVLAAKARDIVRGHWLVLELIPE